MKIDKEYNLIYNETNNRIEIIRIKNRQEINVLEISKNIIIKLSRNEYARLRKLRKYNIVIRYIIKTIENTSRKFYGRQDEKEIEELYEFLKEIIYKEKEIKKKEEK